MLEPETSNNAAANEGWRAAQAQQAAAQAQDAARSKGAELYTQVPRLPSCARSCLAAHVKLCEVQSCEMCLEAGFHVPSGCLRTV